MSFGQCADCGEYLTLDEYNACRYRPDTQTPGLCFGCLYSRAAIVDKLRSAELGCTRWEGKEWVVTLNGKPVGGTIARPVTADRWWGSVKAALLGSRDAAEAAKETGDEH